jgi:hypothetical protein
MASRKQGALSLKKVRSALTNGSALLRNIDHRSAYMRRLRDLLLAHEADLGGRDILSEGQRAIIRRATLLTVQCELMEGKFAKHDGSASNADLDCYQRCCNTLRRLIESLGLNEGRKQRDINTIESDDRKLSRILGYIDGEAEEVSP